MRAYSIASPAWDDALEFYSIKVQDGPLTSKLQHLAAGDEIVMRPKSAGRWCTMRCCRASGSSSSDRHRHRALRPLIREPESYERFEQVILTHSCRQVAELAYGDDLIDRIRADEMLSEMVGEKLMHIATTTREESPRMGRITD